MRNWLIISACLLVFYGCSSPKNGGEEGLVDKFEYLDSVDKNFNPADTAVNSNDDQKPPAVKKDLSWNNLRKIGDIEYVEITWDHLADVTFSEKYYEEVNAYFLYPEFGDQISTLDGAPVVLKGYLVPIPNSGAQKLYALSKNPFSACFFCGNAGPETVAELEIENEEDDLKLDKVYTFKGILSLNNVDINRMNYILKDAESVQE